MIFDPAVSLAVDRCTAKAASLSEALTRATSDAAHLSKRFAAIRDHLRGSRFADFDNLKAPTCVLSHDRFLAVNTAFAHLMGRAVGDLEKHAWAAFVTRDSRATTGSMFGRVTQSPMRFRNTLLTTAGPRPVSWAVEYVGHGCYYSVIHPIEGYPAVVPLAQAG